MERIEVTAERQNCDIPAISVEMRIGENLGELLEQYDEAVCFAHARRSIVTAFQSYIRSLIDKGVEKGSSYEEILDEVKDGVKTWKPSRRKVAKTAKEKAEAILQKLPPSERLAVLKEIDAAILREGNSETAAAAE